MLQPVKITLYALLFILICTGCKQKEPSKPSGPEKLKIVATLFPLYDFARAICGEKGEVALLLPPGVEPHHFEPKPDDIIRISKSAVFIYTNRYMEPWAETIIKGVDSRRLKIVDAGQGVTYLKNNAGEKDDDHDKEHDVKKVETSGHNHSGQYDPHIWLDFANAAIIIDNILAGIVAADPANTSLYRNNATKLKAELAELDKHYQDGLKSCGSRIFLHGGHNTFSYLAQRYNLEYHALSGVSAESEPSAVRMSEMVKQIRKSGVKYLFAEELLSPRLTETLATETGVAVLKLHGVHNLGRDEFKNGITFITLMEENLKMLQKGLACR